MLCTIVNTNARLRSPSSSVYPAVRGVEEYTDPPAIRRASVIDMPEYREEENDRNREGMPTISTYDHPRQQRAL
jgi:hypothetical protein